MSPCHPFQRCSKKARKKRGDAASELPAPSREPRVPEAHGASGSTARRAALRSLRPVHFMSRHVPFVASVWPSFQLTRCERSFWRVPSGGGGQQGRALSGCPGLVAEVPGLVAEVPVWAWLPRLRSEGSDDSVAGHRALWVPPGPSGSRRSETASAPRRQRFPATATSAPSHLPGSVLLRKKKRNQRHLFLNMLISCPKATVRDSDRNH